MVNHLIEAYKLGTICLFMVVILTTDMQELL
jgi:hypothetical protein